MFKFLGFGRKQAPAEATSSVRPEPTGGSLNTRQHSDMQREMVAVVLKDVLRGNGIPSIWMGCEVSARSSRSRGADMHVYLTIRHWNEQLVLHLPLIQKMLSEGLDRFEPAVDHSAYKFSWMLASDCEYPHVQLPNSDSWLPSIGSEHATVKPKFDLPPSDMDRVPQTGTIQSYAPTEPSPLR